MHFEAARDDGPERSFQTLKDALDHIKGSATDQHTRPWVRIVNAPSTGRSLLESFLIVRGRKRVPNRPCPPPPLSTEDAALFEAWAPEPSKEVQALLAEIDLCNNGYARVDCLSQRARNAIGEGVTGQYIQLNGLTDGGIATVHRPGLKIEHGPLPVSAPRAAENDADWEDAILERQERSSMGG